MARAPPPKRMSLDASFHDCEPSIKFDGTNFEDFQFATLAALSPLLDTLAITVSAQSQFRYPNCHNSFQIRPY